MVSIQIKTVDAINLAGNKSKLSRMMGVNRSAVTRWGEYVPELVAWKLNHMEKGNIKSVFLNS